MFIFVEMQIASSHTRVAQNTVGRGELGHDQAASTEILDEATENGVSDSGHRSQNRGWRDANIADGQAIGKHAGMWGDGALPRLDRTCTRAVPELVHKLILLSFPIRPKRKPPARGGFRTSSTRTLFLCFGGLGCFGFPGVALCVFATETLNAAGRIHKLLLSGKERMASRANFYADVALMGRTGGKRVAAGAMHLDFAISGMDRCFHIGS